MTVLVWATVGKMCLILAHFGVLEALAGSLDGNICVVKFVTLWVGVLSLSDTTLWFPHLVVPLG